jgi:hypothetical protein
MPHIISFLYDTSWLMNPQNPFWPKNPWDIYPKDTTYKPPYFFAPFSTYDLRIVVPQEVKQEIMKHYKDDEKKPNASVARTMVSGLMALKGYEEICLESIPAAESKEAILGPDSEVDRKIIGLARKLCTQGIVFVVSHDGGIKCEVSTLRRLENLNMFSPANEIDFGRAVNPPGQTTC